MLQFNEFTSPFSEGGKTGNSNCAEFTCSMWEAAANP